MVQEQQNIGTAGNGIQLDLLNETLIIPAKKLDADQYSADDLDGITESLFGSGNMSYASLQASQTDLMLGTGKLSSTTGDGGLDMGNDGFVSPQSQSAMSGFRGNMLAGSAENSNMDRGLDQADGMESVVMNPGDGNFITATVGSIGASALSSNAGNFGNGLRLGGTDGLSGLDAVTPEAANPADGASGRNGVNGQDGTDGDGGDIIDVGDTINLVENVLNELGDTITNITNTVTDVTNILEEIISNLNLDEIVNLTEVTNIVDSLTTNLQQTVGDTLTEIMNVTQNVTNLLENLLNGEDLVLNLNPNVLDTLGVGVSIPLNDLMKTDLNLNVDLASAIDTVNGLADLAGLDLLSDTLGELGGVTQNLQGTINNLTDLVSGLDLTDPGATVEQLVETLTSLGDTVAGITGSVDGALDGILDNLGIGGDGTLGDAVDGIVADIGGTLDGITNGLTGDLTGGLGDAIDPVTDLVDSVTDGLLDGLSGGGSLGDIVDEAVADIGDTLDGITGGLTGDLTDGLEDAVDPVTDLVDGVADGLLGGLLGGGNNGGTDGDLGLAPDLSVAGLDIPGGALDPNLDLVEDLVGDIDLDLGLGLDLLGGTDDEPGDTDILLQTDIDLIDGTVGELAESISLDPIEDIVGDIDIDAGAALNILGDTAGSLINSGDGGSDQDNLLSDIGDTLADTVGDGLDNLGDLGLLEDGGLTDIADEIMGDLDLDLGGILGGSGSAGTDTGDAGEELADWTESVIDDVGGLFDDLVGGLGGEGDILPDPVGTVAEGLGALGITDNDSGGVGGLLGGLFG